MAERVAESYSMVGSQNPNLEIVPARMGVGGPQEARKEFSCLLSSPGKGGNGALYQGLCFRESWYQILLGE